MPPYENTVYKLEIYGDERIEDETLYFNHFGDAVTTVEWNRSDDCDSWKFDESGARLVDYNNGCAVINKITKIGRKIVNEEIYDDPRHRINC